MFDYVLYSDALLLLRIYVCEFVHKSLSFFIWNNIVAEGEVW